MKNLVFYVHTSHLAVYKHGTSEKMNIGQNAHFWCCVAQTNRIAVIQGVPGGMCQTSGECSLC